MRRLILPLMLFAAVACEPASNDTASQSPLTPEAAVAEVRQVFQQYVNDWNAPNIDAVLAILAEDVVQMPPDTVIVGKDALTISWRQYLDENDDVWEPTIDEIQASGNLVFLRGSFTETATPRAGGDPSTQTGEGIWVFQRDASGAWKLVLEQWFDTGMGV